MADESNTSPAAPVVVDPAPVVIPAPPPAPGEFTPVVTIVATGELGPLPPGQFI